jgi:hypothetical protein
VPVVDAVPADRYAVNPLKKLDTAVTRALASETSG